MLKRPRHEGDYADRGLDCQEALESEVLSLIDRAMSSGWTEAEALAAICDLADNLMLARLEHERLSAVIAGLLKR